MKDSWRTFLRRLAVTSVFSGSVAWSSAMCYAVQLAYDDASDTVYADGWQGSCTTGLCGPAVPVGDNGGFGLGAWSFDGTYNPTGTAAGNDVQHALDDGLKTETQTSSFYNDIGKAWTIFNPVGSAKVSPNPPAGTGIARASRSLPPLQVGQTLKVVVDNPTERQFFRGWTVKLLSGGANGCFEGDNCTTPTYDPGSISTRLGIGTFEYMTNGEWYDGNGGASLFDTDTKDGLEIAITLTGGDGFSVAMSSPGNPVNTDSGTLTGSGPIDWLMIEFYNTDSDPYPNMVCDPQASGCDYGTAFGNVGNTDFYIRSIEIIGAEPAGVAGDYSNDGEVNAADYTIWRDHLNQNFQLQNEGSELTPGVVTIEDYNFWKSRFGMSGSGSSQSVSGVPEPATFVYIVAGFLWILSWRGTKGPKHEEVAQSW